MGKQSEATLLLRIKTAGKEALDDLKDNWDDLAGKVGLAASAISAAITGMLGLSLKAYGESEEASNRLSRAINNQGLDVETLKTRYEALAAAIMAKTTLDDDEVISALALGQQMAGNIALTDELIQATVDYAAATGTDLNSAFDKVGKSIGTTTNALAREGIVLDENAPKSEKMAEITKVLTSRFEGQAEVLAAGTNGAWKQFGNAVGELAEAVGKVLAPAFEMGVRVLTDLINAAAENETLVKLGTVAAVLTAGFAALLGVVGGVVAILPALASGFGLLLTLWPAIVAASAPLIPVLASIIAPAAAVTAAVLALRLAWVNDFLSIQEITFGTFSVIEKIFSTVADNVVKTFGGIKDVIAGAFSLDVEQIKSDISAITSTTELSLEDIKKAYKDGFDSREKYLADTLKAEEEAEKAAAEKIAGKKRTGVNEQTSFALKKKDEELAAKEAKEEAAALKEIERVRRVEEKRQEEIRKADEKAAEEHQKFMDKAGDYAETFITQGFQGVAQAGVSQLVETFLPGFGQAAGALFNLLAMDSDKFLETVNGLFSTEFLDNIAKNIPVLFEVFAEKLPGLITVLADRLPEIVEKLIEALIEHAPEIAIALGKAVTSPSFWEAIALAFANGIANGTRDGLKNLEKIVRDALNKAWDDVKDQFKIKGPGGGTEVDGGLVNKAKSVLGLAAGGTVRPLYAAGGTMVPRGTDTVPAMLTPGEFVVNARAAQANRGMLENINSGGSGGSGVTINLTVNGGLLGDARSAQEFAKAIDSELLKLRFKNGSVAFDSGTV